MVRITTRGSVSFILLLLLCPRAEAGPPSLARAMADRSDLVDAATMVPGLIVELKYSTTDNFMRRDVYGDLVRCHLVRPAAEMLARASAALRQLRPDLHLLAHDCARPVSVQRIMWRQVRGTPDEPYVASPAGGSVHNYGCAVDLTLADERGRPLDMGTAYDASGRLVEPRRERAFRLRGKLSAGQWANRLLLRLVMVQAGFIPLQIEWWHFDCAPAARARRTFRRIP